MWTAKTINYELCDSISFLKNDVIERVLCWKTGKWFWFKNFTRLNFLHILFNRLLKNCFTFLIPPTWIPDECVISKKDLIGKFITLPVVFSVGFLRRSLFCHGLALLKVFFLISSVYSLQLPIITVTIWRTAFKLLKSILHLHYFKQS